MLRKLLVFVVGVLSLVLVFGTVLTRAQEPAPPVSADELDVPEEVAKTVALRESLTADQQASIQAIVARYEPQFQAIADSLPALNDDAAQTAQVFLPLIISASEADVQARTSAAEPADELPAPPNPVVDAATLQALQAAVADLNVLQNQINQEVAAVLTSDQQAQFMVSVDTMQSGLQEVARSADLAAAPQAAQDCYYCTIYGGYAHYYAYYASFYGYYDYLYSGNYSNTYAYYDYLYSYLGYRSIVDGLPYAGGAFADAYYGFGYDYHNWADIAKEYFDVARHLLDLGSISGYYSYSYYGASYGYGYGYWGYYYGYLARDYAYNAYYYAYYCN